MSSLGETDLEAAKAEDVPNVNGSKIHAIAWINPLKWRTTKVNKAVSMPPNATDGEDAVSGGAEYGLMRRTSELRNAIENGDAKYAGEVIDSFDSADTERFSIQDYSGNGLLQISAIRNKPEMIKMLLDKGFNINDIDSNHGTALQAAIYMDHLAVIDVLLDYNGPVTVDVNTAGGFYGCALQVAAFKGSIHLMKRILDHGGDVKTCGGKYGTVLQAAARTGLLWLIRLILEKHLEQYPGEQEKFVNWEGGIYGTALQAAAKGDYTARTRFLRCLSRERFLTQQTDVLRTTSSDKPDYLAVANLLIEKGATIKCHGGKFGSPVGAAAQSGNLEMLQLLVKHDKTAKEERRQAYSSALIFAITQEVVSENRLPLVKILLDEGADADFETGSGLSNRPLTAAAAINATTVMEYLLTKIPGKEARINAESGIYGTALRAALSAKKENAALYLIRNGAAINTTKDEAYGNILHLAAFSKMDEVVELLLQKYRVSVNLRDEAGQTALHVAAYRGYRNIVRILLEYRADPDLEDVWGDTARKIAEDLIERESHPGPSLNDLRNISHQLLEASAKLNRHNPGDIVHGPPILNKPQSSLTQQGTAKTVFASPIWNPGLSFQATISDFLEKDGDEYFTTKSLFIDDLLYRKGAVDELMKLKEQTGSYKKNLRWYHIPLNNMTWAEMLMKVLWAERHPQTACKSFWGTDPYFVSPDLAPHARFITPQSERLIPDVFENPIQTPKSTLYSAAIDAEPDNEAPRNGQSSESAKSFNTSRTPEGSKPSNSAQLAEVPGNVQNTLFLAMPYLHWESYRSSEDMSQVLKRLKNASMKNLILRGGKSWKSDETDIKRITRVAGLDRAQQKQETVVLSTNEPRPDDDDKILEKYLFKRWPIHLRRTLDQYYYSYLADTRLRDGDQVVTKVRNRELDKNERFIRLKSHNYINESLPIGKHQSGSTRHPKNQNGSSRSGEAPSDSLRHEALRKDDNSPLVVVDQLWLWVLDQNTIITSFPRRRLNRQDGDLDVEDKTDILETIMRYLRSAKRHPIQNSYDLSELIISQCIGILHRADVNSDLDVLKIFGTEADSKVDEVMQRVARFVVQFRKFMEDIKNSHRIDSKYIADFEQIFSVTNEALLLREIQDIKDELNMLSAVYQDQLGVLCKVGQDIAKDREELRQTRSATFNFQQQSEKHARHIDRMAVQASQAYDTLKDLLDLKQQQANVLEARVSRNQSLDAEKQGKTIMVFTIVTIIFLPLTFMTTVFTLPVLTFQRWDPTNSTIPMPNGGLLKSGDTFGVIVGVTILMSVPAIVAAFQVGRLQRWWERMRAPRRLYLHKQQLLRQEERQQQNQVKEKQVRQTTTSHHPR